MTITGDPDRSVPLQVTGQLKWQYPSVRDRKAKRGMPASQTSPLSGPTGALL